MSKFILIQIWWRGRWGAKIEKIVPFWTNQYIYLKDQLCRPIRWGGMEVILYFDLEKRLFFPCLTWKFSPLLEGKRITKIFFLAVISQITHLRRKCWNKSFRTLKNKYFYSKRSWGGAKTFKRKSSLKNLQLTRIIFKNLLDSFLVAFFLLGTFHHYVK